MVGLSTQLEAGKTTSLAVRASPPSSQTKSQQRKKEKKTKNLCGREK